MTTHTCPHCQEIFPYWVEYQEHLVLAHRKTQDALGFDSRPQLDAKEAESLAYADEVKDAPPAFARAYSSGRSDLGKREYPGPMREADKKRIVKRGEERLGLHNFIGRDS